MILLGLALLVGGGDLLIRGAVSLARRMGVSSVMIGLTLVGFGTSTPELITSLDAAYAGSPGVAVGNVVGSNTANILLILGLAALLFPITTPGDILKRDGSVMLLAALACLAVVLMGELQRLPGAVLVLLLVGYVGYAYLRERATPVAGSVAAGNSGFGVDPSGGDGGRETAPTGRGWPSGCSVVLVGLGLVLCFLGAHLLVTGAIELARSLAFSETTIGLTIVAVGTSLPELAASLMAAARRQSDIAVGNILGSNIYNVLGILGVTALVKPIPVPDAIVRLDIWVMLAATLLLLVCATTGRRLGRLEGAAFLAIYAGYVGYLAAYPTAAP